MRSSRQVTIGVPERGKKKDLVDVIRREKVDL